MAFLFLYATSRRRDEELALETIEDEAVEADASQSLVPVEAGAPRTGRELERAVALERSRRSAPPPAAAPPPPVPAIPDEETLGVTRRQVLNRGIVTGMLLGISGF